MWKTSLQAEIAQEFEAFGIEDNHKYDVYAEGGHEIRAPQKYRSPRKCEWCRRSFQHARRSQAKFCTEKCQRRYEVHRRQTRQSIARIKLRKMKAAAKLAKRGIHVEEMALRTGCPSSIRR
jgi:hypothetical protein